MKKKFLISLSLLSILSTSAYASKKEDWKEDFNQKTKSKFQQNLALFKKINKEESTHLPLLTAKPLNIPTVLLNKIVEDGNLGIKELLALRQVNKSFHHAADQIILKKKMLKVVKENWELSAYELQNNKKNQCIKKIWPLISYLTIEKNEQDLWVPITHIHDNFPNADVCFSIRSIKPWKNKNPFAPENIEKEFKKMSSFCDTPVYKSLSYELLYNKYTIENWKKDHFELSENILETVKSDICASFKKDYSGLVRPVLNLDLSNIVLFLPEKEDKKDEEKNNNNK